jgi:hypothetical protein
LVNFGFVDRLCFLAAFEQVDTETKELKDNSGSTVVAAIIEPVISVLLVVLF